MKTLQLAELIRSIRRDKLEEQTGAATIAKYKGGTADMQDLTGPNKPINRSEKEQHHKKLEEEDVEEALGANRTRKRNVFKGSLNKASRNWGGQQSTKNRYKTSIMGEEDFEGGTTDTGKPADTVTTKSKTNSKQDKVVADKINTIKENNKRK